LFSLSGSVFGLRIAPLQRRLVAHARASENDEASWKRHEALYRRWEIWGWVAIGAPVAALVIMVIKPPIPGV
jgi:uncharacterized membrane protein